MRTKKKRKSVQSKPKMQGSLDIQIQELAEKIERLWRSDGLEDLEEILRALEERRARRVIVAPECYPYPAMEQWIEPSPKSPFTNPECAGLADGAYSMA